MTALEAVVQRVQTPDHDHSGGSASVHTIDRPHSPARYNLTGHCIHCFKWACDSGQCATHHADAAWEICRLCDGSGLDASKDQACDCVGGLVDMACSDWNNRPAPRPPRLNFAGWCLWCSNQWCNRADCIALHHRSDWLTCDRCDGHGHHPETADDCGCCYGLVEAAK